MTLANILITILPILGLAALGVYELYNSYRSEVKKNEKLDDSLLDLRTKYSQALEDSSKIKEEFSQSYYHRLEYIKVIEIFNSAGQCVKKERETLNHKPYHVEKPLKEINIYEYLKGLLSIEKYYKPEMFSTEIDLEAEPQELIRYEYNKNKQCTLEEHYDSHNTLSFHEANDYDSHGNCIKNKRNSKGCWTIIIDYKYDSKNLCVEEISHSSQVGYANSKNQFEYSKEGNCIKRTYTNMLKLSADYNRTTEYQYEYENNMCIKEFEIVEGDIVDNKKLLQEYTYDNHGNCILEIDYRSDRGLRSKVYRTFNDDNEVSLIITIAGTSIKVENFQRMKLPEL